VGASLKPLPLTEKQSIELAELREKNSQSQKRLELEKKLVQIPDPKLTAGAKTYIESLWYGEKFDFQKTFSNKFVQKGNEVESRSIRELRKLNDSIPNGLKTLTSGRMTNIEQNLISTQKTIIELKEKDVTSQSVKVIGKRNKERIIPISSDLFGLIQTYLLAKKQSEFDSLFLIVLNNGNKLYSKFVYRKINHYLGGVTSMEKRSPHVLRHTFATHMLNNGAGLETLKDILGHASLSATQVYTHSSFTQLTNIYSQSHPRGRKKD
jgi:hypothetical protein